MLDGGLDRQPRHGRCVAGHYSDRIWILPRDGRSYCIRHLRAVLRVATWPKAIRFPDD